ncbi:MAG TPA: SpoIIE family protein phosphatase [Streptosporangiaceae bacterium]|nr:SpoIIE family protein phosphatase [Streptosporangiaceae bacterium]
MPPAGGPIGGTEPPEPEFAELAARRDALEQAAGLPGAQLRPLLDAAFAELDGAIDALTTLQAQAAARKADAPSEQTRSERRMLRAVFAEAPVPLFLLERDGTVRRANNHASDIIGSRPAYAAGKPFTVFVDLPSRAAVQTYLVAAARTGRARQTEAGLLGADGVVPVRLTVEPITLPEDSSVLLVTASYDVPLLPEPPDPDVTPAAQNSPASQAILATEITAAAAAVGADQVTIDQTAAAQAGASYPPVTDAPPATQAPSAADASEATRGKRASKTSKGSSSSRATPATVASARTAASKPAPPRRSGAAQDQERAPSPSATEPSAATMRAVRTMAQRMDLLTAITRLLLENSSFSESLTLQRCARLLAGEFASWVIVDVIRGRRLRRQVAVGPPGEESELTARLVRDTEPEPGTLPAQVHETGKSLLQARSDDTSMLGAGPDGVPLLMKLGATSVLSVPIAEGARGYGVITLCRRAGEGPFHIADLALAEELGGQLAVAIRVDRLFRRRSEVAEALQNSLLPRVLPDVPGIELAAAYMSATEGMDVGGDFYDVYQTPDGWGLTIGDVTGKGEEAAALTAAARYAIRVIAHWEPDPVKVLQRANDVLLATEPGGRFVTAKTAQLAWRRGGLHVSLGTAGHPGPAVIRSDGRVEMTGGGGLPLGLFPEAQPGLEEVALAPGDTLFFFTDGLTETRSPDLRYFEERLSDELVRMAGRSASEVVAGIQARAEAFSAGEMRDDLTVLALRVLDLPGRDEDDDQDDGEGSAAIIELR